MLRIGLTGGIGSGKSTVSGLFRTLGITVLDADDISRELTGPGGRALPAIREAFGASVFRDGMLDRPALRARIFTGAAERRKLEQILHPLVYLELDERARGVVAPYIVFCVPLLLESGRRTWVDRVLVVDVSPETQKERIRRRDGMDSGLIGNILASQLPRSARLEQADDVIGNDGGLDELDRQVGDLHRRYLELAAHAAVD